MTHILVLVCFVTLHLSLEVSTFPARATDLDPSAIWVTSDVSSVRCPKMRNPTYIPDEKGPNYFYRCQYGFATEYRCPEDKVFFFNVFRCANAIDPGYSREVDNDVTDNSIPIRKSKLLNDYAFNIFQGKQNEDWNILNNNVNEVPKDFPENLSSGEAILSFDDDSEELDDDDDEYDDSNEDLGMVLGVEQIKPNSEVGAISRETNDQMGMEHKGGNKMVIRVIQIETVIKTDEVSNETRTQLSDYLKSTAEILQAWTAIVSTGFCNFIGC